jgi:hypothetical protein
VGLWDYGFAIGDGVVVTDWGACGVRGVVGVVAFRGVLRCEGLQEG